MAKRSSSLIGGSVLLGRYIKVATRTQSRSALNIRGEEGWYEAIKYSDSSSIWEWFHILQSYKWLIVLDDRPVWYVTYVVGYVLLAHTYNRGCVVGVHVTHV